MLSVWLNCQPHLIHPPKKMFAWVPLILHSCFSEPFSDAKSTAKDKLYKFLIFSFYRASAPRQTLAPKTAFQEGTVEETHITIRKSSKFPDSGWFSFFLLGLRSVQFFNNCSIHNQKLDLTSIKHPRDFWKQNNVCMPSPKSADSFIYGQETSQSKINRESHCMTKEIKNNIETSYDKSKTKLSQISTTMMHVCEPVRSLNIARM